MDSATALQQLQQYSNSMQNPLDLYNKATTDLGVGDVRGNVNSLRTTLLNTQNALNQVDPSVTGRTSGSLVTEAQRQRLVNLERAPIAQQYSKFAGDYQNESSKLSDLMNQASQQANMGYQGEQQKYNSLKDLYSAAAAREAEARRQAEADRAFAEQQRQFNAQLQANLAASRAAAGGGGGAGGGGTNRDAYNSDLRNLQGALDKRQAPNYEDAVRTLVSKYANRGISPQEIGEYVYQLYSRYFNTSQTKKYYG